MEEQTVLEFYKYVDTKYSGINISKLYVGVNFDEDGFENAGIMTTLAEQVTQIAKEENFKEAKQVLDTIEIAFEKGENTLRSYLYTDFLVTIMEQKKEQREYLKSIMSDKTMNHYRELLKLYQELDK